MPTFLQQLLGASRLLNLTPDCSQLAPPGSWLLLAGSFWLLLAGPFWLLAAPIWPLLAAPSWRAGSFWLLASPGCSWPPLGSGWVHVAFKGCYSTSRRHTFNQAENKIEQSQLVKDSAQDLRESFRIRSSLASKICVDPSENLQRFPGPAPLTSPPKLLMQTWSNLRLWRGPHSPACPPHRATCRARRQVQVERGKPVHIFMPCDRAFLNFC